MPKSIFFFKKTTIIANTLRATRQMKTHRAQRRPYLSFAYALLTKAKAWLPKAWLPKAWLPEGSVLLFKRPGSTHACRRVVLIFMWFTLAFSASAAPTSNIPKHSFYRHFMDVSLRDKYGNFFDAATLQGEVSLFNFIFTRCSGICPVQTKELLDVYNALPAQIRSRVNFVSVSIDPATDTPAQLRNYAELLGADKINWQFLVGDVAKTQQLLHALSLINTPSQQDGGQIDHQSHLWLVDKHGQLMMKYRGQQIDKKRLTHEIGQLSKLP